LSTRTATGINLQTLAPDPKSPIDVYSLRGQRIRYHVERDQATAGLPNGVYIIDKKKIVINR